MEQSIRNRTIALAALFQCVDGVMQVANDGRCDQELLESCVGSVLIDDSLSAEALYGGLPKLRSGLRSLMRQLGGGDELGEGSGKNRQLDATQYSINIMALQKKLQTNPNISNQLMSGITDAQQQLEFFGPTHENMLARLADLYANTISKLGPRIMIRGNQTHLQNDINANMMRSLLLSGVRASLLWNQAGGSRWKLLFERGKMQREAANLLKNMGGDEED